MIWAVLPKFPVVPSAFLLSLPLAIEASVKFVDPEPEIDELFLPTATSVELGRSVLFVRPVEFAAAPRSVELVLLVPFTSAVEEASALEEVEEDRLEEDEDLEDDEDDLEDEELGFQVLLELVLGVHSGSLQELVQTGSGDHVGEGGGGGD